MNKLIEHAGLSGTPFNHDMLKDVQGYDGNRLSLTESDRKGFDALRKSFTQATKDLDQLLRTAGIEFNGIPDESPDESITL